MKFFSSKKLLTIIIVAAFLGGVIGSVFSVRLASAGIFDDIWNFLKGGQAQTSTPPLYKPVIDYEEAVIGAVEQASPSVVSIVISKDLPVIEQCPYNPFSDLPPEFRDFFGGGFEFSRPCEKGTQRQEVGGGSGFVISEDGLILTNKHVVSDTKADYTVLTNDGKKYTAKVLARDPVQDLAVIKIDPSMSSGLRAAILGNSDAVKLGQTAIAIGNALGEFRNTVSVGVISGLARTITASGSGFGTETIQGVMQTDAAINPGNSGGPLLNLKGEVIGINTAIVSGAQNIGFSIPINQAKRDIESVKKSGSIKIPYLGVRYIMLTEDIKGALLRGAEDGPAVAPNSPASKAGLQAEDIILEINGVAIDKDSPLGTLIQRYNIGDTINLKIQRGLPGQGDKILTISATLEERPAINE